MAHILWLDELFATYYVCRIQHDAKVRKKLIDVCDIYVYSVYSRAALARPPYKLLVPYMYIVTAVVYGLEKMESCLWHIHFS